MKFRVSCAAAILMALPAIATAQPTTGPYVSMGGGLNLVDQFSQAFTFAAFRGNGPDVAAAVVTRFYLVFFDWDKSVLTDRARQIVADAAQNSKKVQTTRIEVNGYTDISGTQGYNKDLAVRRAQPVSAELVKGGVKKEEIVVMGYGDTKLLVPTGPGVREPQNRRVEIVLK